MKILVYGKQLKKENIPFIHEVFATLIAYKTNLRIYKRYWDLLKGVVDIEYPFDLVSEGEDLSKLGLDAMLTLGGDGTLLRATTFQGSAEIPILGINLGRLGFLASIEKIHIRRAIEMLFKGMYSIEKRTMLYLESKRNLFDGNPIALNDFTINRRDTSGMITVQTFINGEYLTTFWSDGIIVSTPTGSTGYSLSCGGPIVFPNSGNFIITPIAPHNINIRPIVISDNSIISFKIEGRGNTFLCTLDSRFEKITRKDELAIRKCDFSTNLIQIHDFSFMKTLRNKLTLGSDYRN